MPVVIIVVVADTGALDSVSDGVSYVSTYGSRLGVVAAVGGGVYSEVSGGTGTGWDSTATAAWTGGGAVWNACRNDAEPSYFGRPPPTSP